MNLGMSSALAGLSASYPAYVQGRMQENLADTSDIGLQDLKRTQSARAAMGNALQLLAGGGQGNVVPSGPQQMQPGQPSQPMQQPGMRPPMGGPPPMSLGGGMPQPGGPGPQPQPMMRPPMPQGGPGGGMPQQGGPGGGMPQQSGMQRGQQGALDWRQIVAAVQQSNPGITPDVIAEAVNQFLPMMNQQSQMEWKQLSLQLREQSLNDRMQQFQLAESGRKLRSEEALGARREIAQLSRAAHMEVAQLSARTRNEIEDKREAGRLKFSEMSIEARREIAKLNDDTKRELFSTTEEGREQRSIRTEEGREQRSIRAEEGRDTRAELAMELRREAESGRQQRAELSAKTRTELAQLSAQTRKEIADHLEAGRDERLEFSTAARKDIAKLNTASRKELTTYLESGRQQRAAITEAGREKRFEEGEHGRQMRYGATLGEKQRQFGIREGRLSHAQLVREDRQYKQLELQTQELGRRVTQGNERNQLATWRAKVDAQHKRAMEIIAANSIGSGMSAADRKALVEEENTFYKTQLDEMRDAVGSSTPRGTSAKPGAEKIQERAPAGGGPRTPKEGDVIDGYKFKGGDPAQKENWGKVGG